MIELIVLIIGTIIITLIIYNNTTTEHFEDYILNACPITHKQSYRTDGYVICCDSSVESDICMGNSCTLHDKPIGNIKPCVNILLDRYEKYGEKSCPMDPKTKKRLQYYENNKIENNIVGGCISGLLNNTLTGPRTKQDPNVACKIYVDNNRKAIDSCSNRKRLEEAKCFGVSCEKRLYQEPGGPVLIEIKFKDNNQIIRTAYTGESFKDYLDTLKWDNDKIDKFLKEDIIISEVAEKYYFPSI